MHKILIIGYGYSCKAILTALTGSALPDKTNRFYDIDVFDPQITDGDFLPSNSGIYDAVFICGPSTRTERYLRLLAYSLEFSGLTVITSPAAHELIKRWVLLKPDLVYLPEFFNESNWDRDCIAPKSPIIVGTYSDDARRRIQSLLADSRLMDTAWGSISIKFTDPIVAAMVKHVSSSLFSLKEVFMQGIYEQSKTIIDNEQWQDVVQLLAADKRIGMVT